MTKVRFQKALNSDGILELRRAESGDMQGSIETVLTFAEGQEELAGEVTAMLNMVETRRAFLDHRISSMRGASRDNAAEMAGEQHAEALPLLQEMAQEIGKEVVRWITYADHLWALLTPPEPHYTCAVDVVRGVRGEVSKYPSSTERILPQGMMPVFEEDLRPMRALYGTAMANVRAYEGFLEEIQKRIDQEFGHLPQRPADGPWRQGHKQPRNLYYHEDGGEIGGKFVGVVFDPEDARQIKEALNERHNQKDND